MIKRIKHRPIKVSHPSPPAPSCAKPSGWHASPLKGVESPIPQPPFSENIWLSIWAACYRHPAKWKLCFHTLPAIFEPFQQQLNTSLLHKLRTTLEDVAQWSAFPAPYFTERERPDTGHICSTLLYKRSGHKSGNYTLYARRNHVSVYSSLLCYNGKGDQVGVSSGLPLRKMGLQLSGRTHSLHAEGLRFNYWHLQVGGESLFWYRVVASHLTTPASLCGKCSFGTKIIMNCEWMMDWRFKDLHHSEDQHTNKGLCKHIARLSLAFIMNIWSCHRKEWPLSKTEEGLC